ncbi:uncharacterized protein LOC134219802 [Armigeres subalbatus]|uniref:uncharacterized protein LOC134219802 n=1 Tax=Armigeres subalbatus TaxID=124917 RepID=UPI002ED3D9DC
MSGKTTVKQLQQHGNDSEQDEFDDGVIHDDPGDGNSNPEMEDAAMVEDDELGADSADVSYGVIEALDDYDLERLVYEERSYQEPTVHEETEDPIASETMEDRETQMQSQAGSSKTKKRRSTAVIFDPSDADPGCQTNLILRGTFYKRKFVGETSGSQVASETVVVNTVEEVLRGVWSIAKPFLCREVIFVDGSEGQLPTWADSEPSFEEMNRFIIMQDQGQKRRVTTDKVDSKLLVNWRSKDIKIHIHLFSISVSCRSLWDIVDKQLIRPQNADRAGAPNNQTVYYV